MATFYRSLEEREEKVDDGGKEKEGVRDNKGCCIICVGSTGTGKSSTVGICTGAQCKAGSGSERVTLRSQIYGTDKTMEPVWVDTVGWDDAEIDDDQTFRDILTFIDRNNITAVTAVIWNISPNVRCDAMLSGQARLINMFCPEVWSNVLVVAKQSHSPEVDCQGALRAAQAYTQDTVLHTGYRLMSDPTFSAAQRDKFCSPEERAVFNVKTDQEVAALVSQKLAEMPPPVQVVFRSNKCKDCGLVGDPRLLLPYCHLEPKLVHREEVAQHHPGQLEKHHPSPHTIQEHSGSLSKRCCSNLMCGTWSKSRYTCCKRGAGQEGCKRMWACCMEEWQVEGLGGCASRYTCCQASVSHLGGGCTPRFPCCGGTVTGPGCREVCKKCDCDWGSPTTDCFKREHNLAPLEG